MKTKIGIVLFVVTVLSLRFMQHENESSFDSLSLQNVEALASGEGNSCPNGCLANGNGCYCNGWYPCYREASW